MKETLHFSYESPENLVRLLTNINYEKTHSNMEISIYYQRLDKEPDSFFYDVMCKLYPSGTTVDIKEIQEITEYIHNFLETDEEAKELKAQWEMQHLSSYVYFKLDKKVYPCGFAKHSKTVRDICVDYFKDFEKDILTVEMIEKFILDNFTIASSNSSIYSIAKDSYFIYECILFNDLCD